MSLAVCIPDLLAKGAITPEQAERAQRLFNEMSSQLRRSMAADAADATASSRAVEALEFEEIERRRRLLRQVETQRGIDAWMRGGGENWGRGGRNMPPESPLPGEGPAGGINPAAGRRLIVRVDARRKAIEARAFAEIEGILAQHRATITGRLRNPAEMDEIGRATYGERGKSLAADELADSWFRATETLRLRANAAGASIGKLERWGLPQSWDSRAVQQAGFDNWFAAEKDRWDLDRMTDNETGQPFTEEGLVRAARYMFESIVSDGALHREPGAGGRASLARRLGEHRVIFYKSYDDWKASREQFGTGTAFDAMMGHVRGMARNIAAMEILGPNPETGVKYLRDTITGDVTLFDAGGLRKRDSAQGDALAVQRLWDEYTGALRQPETRWLAQAFGTYRSIATSTKLGGAALTAVGDVGFQQATRRFNGLPQVSILKDYLKMLNPASIEDRRLAARLGFIADTWTTTVAGQNRFLAEELTGEVSRRIAEGVLRASGLNAWTDAGRMAMGLTWLTHITNERGKAWDQLEPAFRSAMQRYGIGAEGWDSIRATPVEEDGGADWIKPQNIENADLGDRLLEMMHNETDFAVPTPDLETRAYINANARRGTALGELIRSSPLMFKTFTVGMMIRHGGRMLDQPGIGGKAGYFLSLFIPVTLMGAMAVQLKEIAKGRDPRPMDPSSTTGRKFWGHAIVTGGGAGIFGDLIGVTAEERLSGWQQFAAGPLAGDLDRLSSGVMDIAQGDERGAWKTGASLRSAMLPGQNLWYLRLAMDRLIADQIQREIDPNYHQGWRRAQRMASDQGTGFWWGIGEAAPDRAPALENVAN